MVQQVPLLFVALIANLLIMIGLSLLAWDRRHHPGVRSYFWFSVAVIMWGGAATLSTLAGDQRTAAFLHNQVRMIAIVLVPITLIGFAIDYTGQRHLLPPRRVALLFIIPAITTALNWLYPRSMIYDLEFEQHDGFLFHSGNDYGPWFWVHMVYSYLLVGSTIYLLYSFARRSTYPYRQQALLFLAGLGLGLVANIINSVAYLPATLHDLSVLTFGITAMIWGTALFRFQLFETMPVARDAVLESMNDAALVVDTEGRLLDLNPAASLFVREGAAAIGEPVSALVVGLADRLQEGQPSAEVDFQVEGTPRTFDMRVSNVTLRGRRAGRLIVLRDITARKRAENEREVLIRELDAYAHTVAHDLKGPLNTILGFSYIVQQDAPVLSIEELQKYLGQIERGAQRMNRIIDELLLLATVRNQEAVPIEPLDMRTVVMEVVARFRFTLDESNASLTLPGEWPTVLGHGPWIEEIWANYISNALKYGGTPPLVELGFDQPTPERVRFWVRDNGPGLTEAERQNLFVEFARVGQVRARGHGLGLSIVRRIAERLNGEVGVEGVEDSGSRFWFTLPTDPTTAV